MENLCNNPDSLNKISFFTTECSKEIKEGKKCESNAESNHKAEMASYRWKIVEIVSEKGESISALSIKKKENATL